MRLELLGIVSYNLWRLNKPQNIVKDVTYLMGRNDVDVICTQESAGWYHLVSALVDETKGAWRMAEVDGTVRGAKQCMVLWRISRVTAQKIKYIDLPENKKGVPDRWITRVRFGIKGSDKQLVVLGTHMHSHVENKSWWWLPRQLDYRKHVAIIQSLIKHAPKERAVIAVADWNVDMRSKVSGAVPFFPKKMFGKVGAHSNWEALGFKGFPGTHGSRYIDAVFLRACSWLRFRDQQVIKLTSDHRAILVRLQVAHGSNATPK